MTGVDGRSNARKRSPNTVTFSYKLDNELRDELDLIAEFERAPSPSELVRTWTRLQVNSYRGNKLYQIWRERKAVEAKL